jgi:hypothetical protein
MTIDGQVDEICPTCFMETYSLERVTFTQPSRVIIIGFSAFNACSVLLRIDISRSITKRGEMTFGFCGALEEVTFAARSRLELIEDSAFGSCDKLVPVDVPARAKIKGKVKVLEVIDHRDRSKRRRIQFQHYCCSSKQVHTSDLVLFLLLIVFLNHEIVMRSDTN